MNAVLVSMKEIVSCRGKLRDVFIGQKGSQTEAIFHKGLTAQSKNGTYWLNRITKVSNYSSESENDEGERTSRVLNSMPEVVFMRNYIRNRYHELDNGDLSRTIVQTIFYAALSRSSKQSTKIERVLTVKNPTEIIERFEKFREMVKKMASEKSKKHPRSIVDGNEILRFYGTTMHCCRGRKGKISLLCKDPTCHLCRIIQFDFDTEDTRRNGIRLSTSSKALSEKTYKIIKERHIKRAAIICRVISGEVVDIDRKSEIGDDATTGRMLSSKSEYLVTQNPSAVLPCFVIVFT